MIFPFDSFARSIVVPARVFGPRRELILRFLLDTGATTSAIMWQSAEDMGYNPSSVTELAQTITANGVMFAPKITFERIETLGQEQHNFLMLCHSLLASADVDGVLGLDFFRGHKLTIDFRIGLITLE